MDEKIIDVEQNAFLGMYKSGNDVYAEIVKAIETVPILDRDKLKRRLKYYLDTHTEKRF